ncbi:MAG: GatB/YqeY domain-containing protein [Candidatus Zixiibacteriota bacterium]
MPDPGGAQAGISLKQRLDQDMRNALKSKDSLRLGVLRMLKSEIRYKEIEKRADLSDDEVISVLSSSVKKHKDSIEAFDKGGREDLVSREKAELEMIEAYLPEQLTEEELSGAIHQAIVEANASGPADLGKVMRSVMLKVKGKAEGKLVTQLVSSQLQSISGPK